MSGNNESKTQYVADKLKELDEQIDGIERAYSLYTVVHNQEIDNLINMSDRELDKLTPDECMKASFSCLQYSIVIQKAINRAKAVKSYCSRNLGLIVAKEYGNYKGEKYMPFEVIKAKVVLSNSYASKLDEYVNQQDLKLSTLEDMVKHAQNMSFIFKNLSYSKKGERYVHESY